MKHGFDPRRRVGRREFLTILGAGLAAGGRVSAAGPATRSTNIIEFEERLAAMRSAYYRQRTVDIIQDGFRPVGGMVADFAVAELEGRYHFFYIERRLLEGTPFYPGHETYFGHASTRDFTKWEVHDPVLMVRPDSWEEAHVWAPCILQRGDEYIMAYTGVNRHLSQDIGLASSKDLFAWRRWETNPISPCKGAAWAFWRQDGIASCRDPNLFEHDGRIWMNYSANTKEGASCIALASTPDLRTWKDHGPILVGPNSGYEPKLGGGHVQGSLESARLLPVSGRFHLLVKAAVRDSKVRNWIFESDRIDSFDFAKGREFWRGALGVEVVKTSGHRALLATFAGGVIRLGETDWSAPRPAAEFLKTAAALESWLR